MSEIEFRIPRNEWWSQNRRGGWRARYARTSAVKRRAYVTVRDWLNKGNRPPDGWPVHVTATIHPLTHGRFDPENAAPMVKAILDACTQAGLWPDDDHTHIIGPDYRPGGPSPDGACYTITITIERNQQ